LIRNFGYVGLILVRTFSYVGIKLDFVLCFYLRGVQVESWSVSIVIWGPN